MNAVTARIRGRTSPARVLSATLDTRRTSTTRSSVFRILRLYNTARAYVILLEIIAKTKDTPEQSLEEVRQRKWRFRMRDGGIGLRLLSSLVLLVLFTVFANGQGSPTASLSGVVSDQSGAVIPGAEVSAKNIANGTELKTITVENGTYTIPAVDPGTYTVAVILPGFKQAVVNN